ncbi:hypothetical protein DFJ74DRAFT_678019 [Hyaloraphidium curvatum]|nr:hypothetical protein DFJ74DRAFT_678019 [Hyaloraphidium curvatum]
MALLPARVPLPRLLGALAFLALLPLLLPALRASGPRPLRVAVCVAGLAARLEPDFLLRALVLANPAVRFSLFFRLQSDVTASGDKPLDLHSTAGNASFLPGRFAGLPEDALAAELRKTFAPAGNVELLDARLADPLPRAEWTERMGGSDLKVIGLFSPIQHKVLNMFQNQLSCAAAVREAEETRGAYDHLVSTREDVWFFRPVDMARLSEAGRGCELAAKKCLAWGGLNLRFQMYTGPRKLDALASRLAYYRNLSDARDSVVNTEMFEGRQVHEMGLRRCLLPVGMIPAAVARHVAGGRFCILQVEYRTEEEECYPPGALDWLRARDCHAGRPADWRPVENPGDAMPP